MGEIEVKMVRICPKHGTTTNYVADYNCLEENCGLHTKEEVITGDIGIVSLGAAPLTEVQPTAPAPPSKKRMCMVYNKEIAEDSRTCPYCGADLLAGTVAEGTVTAMAATVGLIFQGIGHIMVGKTWQFLIRILASVVLIAGIVACLIYGYDEEDETYYLIAAVLGIVFLALYVWQVIDASQAARQRNRDIENHKIS